MDTQMQCGSTDCGVFATALATALANEEKPAWRVPFGAAIDVKAFDALFGGAISLPAFPATQRRAEKVKVLTCTCVLFMPYD